MPKRTNAFQRLIYLIYRAAETNGAVVESEFLIDRATGDEVEVDAVITVPTATTPVIISIECRDGRRKAGLEWVREMYGKHESLPTNQLILISKSGFTHTAAAKAKSLGIHLFTLEEAHAANWSGVFANLARLEFVRQTLRITHCVIDESRVVGNPPLSERVLSEPEFLEALFQTIKQSPDFQEVTQDARLKDKGGEVEITLELTPPILMRDDSGRVLYVKTVTAKIAVEFDRRDVKLRYSSLGRLRVAHGEEDELIGPIEVALVERADGSVTMGAAMRNEAGQLHNVVAAPFLTE
jgi:hypothetical protein